MDSLADSFQCHADIHDQREIGKPIMAPLRHLLQCSLVHVTHYQSHFCGCLVAYIFFRILARTEVPASTSVAFVVLGALTLMTVILQGVCISFALCRAAAVHNWEQIRWNPLDFVLRKYQLCSFSAWTHHFRCFLVFYSVLIHPLDLLTTLDFGMQIANSLVLSSARTG